MLPHTKNPVPIAKTKFTMAIKFYDQENSRSRETFEVSMKIYTHLSILTNTHTHTFVRLIA